VPRCVLSCPSYGATPLSTVRQPRRDMGQAAMSLLVDLLEGRRPAARDIVLPHQFIDRASCGSASAEVCLGG
jgi:DNA-binding LacI/PurR family transcriptional regulator